MISYDDADKDGRLNINEFYMAFSKLYSKSLIKKKTEKRNRLFSFFEPFYFLIFYYFLFIISYFLILLHDVVLNFPFTHIVNFPYLYLCFHKLSNVQFSFYKNRKISFPLIFIYIFFLTFSIFVFIFQSECVLKKKIPNGFSRCVKSSVFHYFFFSPLDILPEILLHLAPIKHSLIFFFSLRHLEIQKVRI